MVHRSTRDHGSQADVVLLVSGTEGGWSCALIGRHAGDLGVPGGRVAERAAALKVGRAAFRLAPARHSRYNQTRGRLCHLRRSAAAHLHKMPTPMQSHLGTEESPYS